METDNEEKYLERLIEKATPKWQDINPDEWLRKIRGDYSSQNSRSSDNESSI